MRLNVPAALFSFQSSQARLQLLFLAHSCLTEVKRIDLYTDTLAVHHLSSQISKSIAAAFSHAQPHCVCATSCKPFPSLSLKYQVSLDLLLGPYTMQCHFLVNV
jgi:hypothetical protein